ncbi:hypothetical protein [Cohnella algarum]|uniref:hypothetical protein n=1 Tax=Cohnella algarum TaxID=2044859 RepID=UPI001967258E|nr:hypothetical protein [Cohnella algarum]MBN2980308.1 hypothetical protein [Cohnella algarum]
MPIENLNSPSANIYIVLSATGTMFSNTIKWFTKDDLNHASIAFDPGLHEVYSFGRKKLRNPLFAGLIRENFRDSFYGNADCAVFRCPVPAEEYHRMREYVETMMADCDRYGYSLLGLAGVLLKKELHRKNTYFCSHFVASVLMRSSLYTFDKSPCFVTPGNLEQAFRSYEIYRGKMSGYLGPRWYIPPIPAIV